MKDILILLLLLLVAAVAVVVVIVVVARIAIRGATNLSVCHQGWSLLHRPHHHSTPALALSAQHLEQ